MHRWKFSALASAAVISAALSPFDAAALTLGTLSVQSALGENLRAEISLPQATVAEINSLAASIAAPEVFRAQGMDYSAAANTITVQIHRHADGTASLRLSSTAPINDPFVDLVLQTQWHAGQMVRNYTLLLDQPQAQRSPAAPARAPQVTAAPPSVKGRSYNSKAAPKQRVVPGTSASANTAVKEPVPEGSVRVRTGDTAGRIASANRPSGVSLDQMLVAMLRSNPKAFINGNVNRMRAGVVIQIPNRDQALETSVSEARSIVAAQSRDFNAYRRSLAAKAPKATVQNANRSASGKVQAQVAETRPAAEAPDKLTLSKGNMQSAAAEAQVAAQKQTADQDNRLSELQRNLAELNELAQKSPEPAAAATDNAPTGSASAASAPPASSPAESNAQPSAGVEVASATLAQSTPPASSTAGDSTAAPSPTAAPEEAPPSTATPAVTTPDAPADSANASATTTATAADSTAQPEADAGATGAATPETSTPTGEAPSITNAAAPAAQATSEANSSNLWLPVGAGLLAAVLAGLGYTAWKRRREGEDNAATADDDRPSMADPALETEGATDTEAASTPAEPAADNLDTSDPIAEAEMYLAYGRDVQAEEVLKAAMRDRPDDAACALKLAEIYVKRQDLKSLEDLAQSMQRAGLADSPQWMQVLAMGRNLNPSHPYFASVGLPETSAPTSSATKGVSTSAFAAALDSAKADLPATQSGAPLEQPAAAPVDKMPDLEWDLDLSNQTTAGSAAPANSTPEIAPEKGPSASLNDLDLDLTAFDLPEVKPPFAAPPEVTPADDADPFSTLTTSEEAATPPVPAAPAELDSTIDMATPAAASAPSSAPEPSPAPLTSAPKSAEVDLGSLDLDMGSSSPAPAASTQPVHNLSGDSLSTKLDLAQEFNSIGDSEGARTLIEEVLAEASGPLKERAQKMLSELD